MGVSKVPERRRETPTRRADRRLSSSPLPIQPDPGFYQGGGGGAPLSKPASRGTPASLPGGGLHRPPTAVETRIVALRKSAHRETRLFRVRGFPASRPPENRFLPSPRPKPGSSDVVPTGSVALVLKPSADKSVAKDRRRAGVGTERRVGPGTEHRQPIPRPRLVAQVTQPVHLGIHSTIPHLGRDEASGPKNGMNLP